MAEDSIWENERLLSPNNLNKDSHNKKPIGYTIIDIPSAAKTNSSKKINLMSLSDKKEELSRFSNSQKVDKAFFTSQLIRNRKRLVEIAEKNIFQLISELDSLNKKHIEDSSKLVAERTLPSVNSSDLARLRKSKRTKVVARIADDFRTGLDLVAQRMLCDSSKSKEWKMLEICNLKVQHIQIIVKLAANQERKNTIYRDKIAAISRDLNDVLNGLEMSTSNQIDSLENTIHETKLEAQSSLSKYDWSIMAIKKRFTVNLLALTKSLYENITQNQGQEVENYFSKYYVSPLAKKQNQDKEMIEMLNKIHAELIRISIVDENQTRELKVFNKQQNCAYKELYESLQMDSKDVHRREFIIGPLQETIANWIQLPMVQSFKMLLENNFSIDSLKDFLWKLRVSNEIPLCEEIFRKSITHDPAFNEKWLSFEAQAANFLKQSFRSVLKSCKDVDKLQITIIINQINFELIPTIEKEKILMDDYKNAIEVLYEQLNQKRVLIQEAEVDRDQILYNQMNYGQLMKIVANLSFKKQDYIKTEQKIVKKEDRFEVWKQKSSSLTRLLLIECSQYLLSSFAQDNGYSIFKLIFENIPTQRVPGDMIELIKDFLQIVFDYEICVEKKIVFKELDDYLTSNIKNDKKISVLKCFLKYLPLDSFDFNKYQLDWHGSEMHTLTPIQNFLEFKGTFKDYLQKLQLKHNAQHSKTSKMYQRELQRDCINLTEIARQNLNEDLIRFLIFHESTDLETKFLLLVIVCKAGFHRTLKELLTMTGKGQISANVSKKMMFAVLDSIMLRMGQKSYKSFLNDRVDHFLCFDLLNTDKNLGKNFGFLFMKKALLTGYEEVVLKLFQNGYKIDSTNDAGESFLTVCKSPEMLKRVLDNSVSIDHSQEPKINLKIDYRFLKLAEKVRTASTLQLIQHNKQFTPLINHPALSTYIEIKYKKFQALHSLNFSIFFILLLLQMASVLLYISYNHQWRYALSLAYSICPIYVLIRECIQIKSFYGLNYIRSNENWVEILLVFFGSLGILAMFTDEEVALKGVTGFFMIFAITELLFLLAKISTQTRVTMKMFSAVANIYLKLSLLILIVVCGFGYSFYLIFALPVDKHNNAEDYNNFQGARYAFVKTLIMLTGEFDASNLLLLDFHKFVFTVIFVLVAVTIFNFLNALAFGEIASLKSSADFEILREKLRKVCSYEGIFDRTNFRFKCLDKTIFDFSRTIDGLDAVYIERQYTIKTTRSLSYQKKMMKLRKNGQEFNVATIREEVIEQLEELSRKNGVLNLN